MWRGEGRRRRCAARCSSADEAAVRIAAWKTTTRVRARWGARSRGRHHAPTGGGVLSALPRGIGGGSKFVSSNRPGGRPTSKQVENADENRPRANIPYGMFALGIAARSNLWRALSARVGGEAPVALGPRRCGRRMGKDDLLGEGARLHASDRATRGLEMRPQEVRRRVARSYTKGVESTVGPTGTVGLSYMTLVVHDS